MEQPSQDKTSTHGEKETYQYLGILEADTIKQVQIKEKKRKKNNIGGLEIYLRQNCLTQTLSME